MESRHSSLRTAEVARDVGYSAQQVRNLERDEVLPPAARTPSGYRMYDIRHLRWARAYRDLAAAVGPVEARAMLRGAHGWQAPTCSSGSTRPTPGCTANVAT